MSESASAIESTGPSLEQILWRAVDRFSDRPALVDQEEFANHIAGVFEGDVPAEAWVERFFRGEDFRDGGPADMAEAVVRATRDRLAVYEFDLNRLEYVLFEGEDKTVVVSDFGQFAVQTDDFVRRAVEAAVVGGASSIGSVPTDRGTGSEPRAFYVRKSGEVVALDVQKAARALEKILVKQVDMPAVEEAGLRLLPFGPTKRAMSEAREARALRQDARLAQPLSPPPPRLMGLFGRAAEATAARATALPLPSTAEQAVFVLMPDGTLARPAMGAASRFADLIGDWSARAAQASSTVAISGEQRFVVQQGQVVAIFSGGQTSGAPGFAGERALAQGEAMAAVRSDVAGAPVRVMGDDELATALASGAMMVPGYVQAGTTAPDRFWIQPEATFAPSAARGNALAQDSSARESVLAQGGTAPTEGALVEGAAESGAAVPAGSLPMQLGQVTGDPWSDWALMGGSAQNPAAVLAAARGRSLPAAFAEREVDAAPASGTFARRLRAARFSRDLEPQSAAPALRLRGAPSGQDLLVSGAPVVAFRAPDGSVLLQRAGGAIRLASLDRDPGELPRPRAATTRKDLTPRTGALPAGALAALQVALERTAATGGYKLPVARFTSSATAIEDGRALPLAARDTRRSQTRLAGPVTLGTSASRTTAELLLSMPFPNRGEIHVGSDLAEALQSFATVPVVPAGSGETTSATPAFLGGAAGAGFTLALKPVVARGAQGAVGNAEWIARNEQAVGRARDALVTLELPEGEDAQPSSLAGLPSLLRQAIAQGGQWVPGPGAPMPGAVRELALQRPFDLPELVEGAPISQAVAAAAPRSANPGEDEIVIPMPLWAQMGRGRLSSTGAIMASPLAERGYAPPLGMYRLVTPNGGPVDMTGGAPAGAPGVVKLVGPTSLRLAGVDGGRGVEASTMGGQHLLGSVLLDDPQIARRGRGRIGAPLDSAAAQARVQKAREAQLAQAQVPAALVTPDVGGSPVTSQADTFETAPSASVATASAWSADAPGGGARPMAGALNSALRLSQDIAARAAPESANTVSRSSATSFDTVRAPVVSGAFSPAGSTASTTPAEAGSSVAEVERSVAASRPAASGAPIVEGLRPGASGAPIVEGLRPGASGAPIVEGLRPGAWSGALPNQSNHQRWRYQDRRPDVPQTAGGIALGSLSRPTYPSLPTSLRFRYAGAPLWWSRSTAPALAATGGDAAEQDLAQAPAAEALTAGVRAANSAAALWRSIFVSLPAAADGDLSGGMDTRRDQTAEAMSPLSSKLDALAAAALVASGGAAGAAAGKSVDNIYLALDSKGGAGTVTASAAQRAKADALDLKIVAAIPPRPPPLESTSTSATGGDAPHARGKGHTPHGHGAEKEASDAVSASKIEGSVDAIAQRIYHRIRRRIQSDRERFGG